MRSFLTSVSIGVNRLFQDQRPVVALLLVAATLLVYAPIRGHQFLHYDDDHYVTEDVRIREGLTWDNLLWALTAIEEALWKPLTLYSHMLDVELFGLNPAGHLLVNLLIHVGNVLLLFLILYRATGALWRSALVAGLFALHPLGVESVAWVAERKNVLSTFFWLVTMGAYVGYVRKPGRLRYLGVMGALVLGLMSKPMVVTLPFALLLMDYWPLERLPARWAEFRKRLPGLMVEKLPFLVPVVASSAVTLYGAQTQQGLQTLGEISVGARLGNSLLGYGLYLKKMVWPVDLAVIYPLSRNALSSWPVILSAVVLAAITVVVWRRREGSRYLVVGWCWYLGTLVPVNGLLQSGFQAMADRYSYVPLIGIFIMLSWGGVEILGDQKQGRKWLAGTAGCVLLTLALLTRVQLSYWQDTTTLFEHTVQVTANNHIAHYILATGLLKRGELEEATEHLQEAVRINPKNYMAQTVLGQVMAGEGAFEKAEEILSQALRLSPGHAEPHSGMGFLRLRQGRLAEAAGYFTEALKYNSQLAEAHNYLGFLQASEGRLEEALEHLSQALEIDPELIEAQRNLGNVLSQQGKNDEAIESFGRVLELAPDDAMTHNNLGAVLLQEGEIDEAIRHFSEAVRIDPDYRTAQENLDRIQSR